MQEILLINNCMGMNDVDIYEIILFLFLVRCRLNYPSNFKPEKKTSKNCILLGCLAAISSKHGLVMHIFLERYHANKAHNFNDMCCHYTR
jgi:hypothetical protein